MEYTKDLISEQLRKSICEVVFTKTDGTERIMKCTLMEDIVEPYINEINERNKKLLQEGKEIKKIKSNPNVLAVIDVEINEWRSFKIDAVKSVKEINHI